MPREGVPYPERLLCSVRCELKNIWTALSGKLHSVNGVEGDGAGNVNIVSGDAAVVVTTDPSLNQIEVSLDQSQLPAAAVTSVNGQTGTVVLGGTDIKTAVYGPNNSAMQDIGAARTAIQTTNQNLGAEATARQNADSALQTNINASNLRISNIENAVSADPDPDTIGLRDDNGRLKAADPASGATDKTLVTANWISQTGDSGPNNVLHKTGNETKTGVTTFISPQEGAWNAHRFYFSATTGGNWYKIAEISNLTAIYQNECLNWVINSSYFNANKGGVALLSLIIPNASAIEGFIHSYKSNQADIWANFAIKIGKKNDGNLEVFAKGRDYTTYSFLCYSAFVGTRSMSPYESITAVSPTIVPEPQAEDYAQLITVTI